MQNATTLVGQALVPSAVAIKRLPHLLPELGLRIAQPVRFEVLGLRAPPFSRLESYPLIMKVGERKSTPIGQERLHSWRLTRIEKLDGDHPPMVCEMAGLPCYETPVVRRIPQCSTMCTRSISASAFVSCGSRSPRVLRAVEAGQSYAGPSTSGCVSLRHRRPPRRRRCRCPLAMRRRMGFRASGRGALQ